MYQDVRAAWVRWRAVDEAQRCWKMNSQVVLWVVVYFEHQVLDTWTRIKVLKKNLKSEV